MLLNNSDKMEVNIPIVKYTKGIVLGFQKEIKTLTEIPNSYHLFRLRSGEQCTLLPKEQS